MQTYRASSFALRSTSLALILVATSARFSYGAAKYEVTVEAGKHDRVNVPIAVEFVDRDTTLNVNNPNVRLKHDGGDAVGQVTLPCLAATIAHPVKPQSFSLPPATRRELHFVVPSLKAGTTAKFEFSFEQPMQSSDVPYFYFEDSDAETTIGEHDRRAPHMKFLTYVHPTLDDSSKTARESTYKPYHHVWSPDGSRIVTKGPGGKYTHHRGLYFGFNRISYGPDFAKKCDVWHCSGQAYQNHEEERSREAGDVLARHTLAIGWHGAEGEKFASEEREVTVYNLPDLRFIDFASVVRTVDGLPIKLDGDPQHAGFHFRADNEVAASTAKETYYLRPDGKGAPGETRNWDAKSQNPAAVNEMWKVMSFVLGGKRYSVLRLDTPENPGEKRSSERDYGRFGGYFEYEITREKPLAVRYRVILKAGEFTADEAVRLSNDFINPPKVTIKPL